jgi:hypothetical protein
MSHGHTKISSKGVCIYCGRNDTRRTDEHVVPFSLGGQHVLLDASCACADITKRFEQDVAREMWGDARNSFNAPTRRMDGPLAPIACASRSAYQPCRDCKSVRSCAVRLAMTKVRDAISEVLDRMTIADMVAIGEGSNVASMVPRGRALQNRKPVRGSGRALAGSDG